MMMNKHFVYLFSTSILLFVGCNDVEEDGLADLDKGKTIEVSTYVQQNTRAENKTDFSDGEAIGLWGCKTPTNYADAFSSNFMNNVQVVKGETGWTYSPLSLWPTNTEERLSFVAFYPYNASQGSGLTYTYTVNEDPSLQEDILWATVKDAHANDRNGSAINGDETEASFEALTGPVNLKFQHALTKVQFQIKLNTEYAGTTAVLKSFSISNVALRGTCNISNDLSGISWSGQNNLHTFVLFNSEETLSTDLLKIGEPMFMIPQHTIDMSINIEYEYTLETETKTVSQSYVLSADWEANKSYIYTVDLALNLAVIDVSTAISTLGGEDVEETAKEESLAVDLGLPSGLKWASHNLGATKPTDYGNYYAWGETSTKSKYTEKNYQYYNSSTGSYVNIGEDISGTSYDVAHVTWGEGWRMPTRSDFSQLVDQCTWTWKTLNGINGYQVIGINGNSIFLPAGGYYSDATNDYEGTYGCYWMATGGKAMSYNFNMTISKTSLNSMHNNFCGLSIRPVKD